MKNLYANNSICYLDDRNRKGISLALLHSAITCLRKTKKLDRYADLQTAIAKLPIKETDDDVEEVFDSFHSFTETALLDDVMICIFFENYMKGVLLNSGFVIHDLNNGGQKVQRTQPVSVTDLLKTEKFEYDGKMNSLSGIKKNTLKFSTLLESKYQDVIQLPSDLLELCRSINHRRNTLHFLLATVSAYDSKLLSELQKLVRFVNEIAIPLHNELSKELGFPASRSFDPIRLSQEGDHEVGPSCLAGVSRRDRPGFEA